MKRMDIEGMREREREREAPQMLRNGVAIEQREQAKFRREKHAAVSIAGKGFTLDRPSFSVA